MKLDLDLDNLRSDSIDFTEAEAEKAISVESAAAMIDNLRARRCLECGDQVFPSSHEQRRLAGVMYCRMRLACGDMHETRLVFRVRDLQMAVE